MKSLKTLSVIALAGILAGCGTAPPTWSIPITRTAVATGVALGLEKATNALPYVRAAGGVICASAASTNVAPGQIVAALEASDAAQFKTAEAVIIVNGAVGIYNTVYVALGTNTAAAQPYLQAVCDGINDALPSTGALRTARRTVALPPHVK